MFLNAKLTESILTLSRLHLQLPSIYIHDFQFVKITWKFVFLVQNIKICVANHVNANFYQYFEPDISGVIGSRIVNYCERATSIDKFHGNANEKNDENMLNVLEIMRIS